MDNVKEIRRIYSYWHDKNIDFTNSAKIRIESASKKLSSLFLENYCFPQFEEQGFEEYKNLVDLDELKENSKRLNSSIKDIYSIRICIELNNWLTTALFVGYDAVVSGRDKMLTSQDWNRNIIKIEDELSRQLLRSIYFLVLDYLKVFLNENENKNEFENIINSDNGKQFIKNLIFFLYSFYGIGLLGGEVYTNKISLKYG